MSAEGTKFGRRSTTVRFIEEVLSGKPALVRVLKHLFASPAQIVVGGSGRRGAQTALSSDGI
jgi:hypothetical protein